MSSSFTLPPSSFRRSRRDWLRAAALGALAPSASGWLPLLAARAAAADTKPNRAKSVILLWMSGGPSQVHTFTLHADGPHKEYEGTQTAVPGVRISEHLPKLAASMKDLALIRTMSTGVNVHGQGHYLMHMGYRQGGTDYPSLGAIVAKENGDPANPLPNYVNLNAGQIGDGIYSPGVLGPNYAPLMAAGKGGVQDLKPADPDRDRQRAELLQKVEGRAVERFQTDSVLAHQASYRKAVELMRTDKTKVFRVDDEPAKLREEYGADEFGLGCLLARRLVEGGVNFVEVSWGGRGGVAWDSHGGGAESVKKKSPSLDAGFSTLVRDLKDRGLLDTTLVVWMGEFGRGPRPGQGGGINGGIGSGHFARCWTTVLAGAGIKTGQVIGRPSKDLCDPEETPVSAGDFFATVMKAVGIDHAKSYDAGGRPIPYTMFGSKPVEQLF